MTNPPTAICTATVFGAFLGSIWAGFSIHVTNSIWWDQGFAERMQKHENLRTASLIEWVFLNIISPACVVVLGYLLLAGLWAFSDYVCSQLKRAKEAQKP